MRWVAVLAIIAVSAACAALDQPQPEGADRAGRDCFNVGMVTGYETVDTDTIRLDAGPSAKYDVDLSGGQCRDVDWTQRLAIDSTPSSWLCVGSQPGQGNIRFRDPPTRRAVSCYIQAVRRAPAPQGS
jgi:hypothetical protein